MNLQRRPLLHAIAFIAAALLTRVAVAEPVAQSQPGSREVAPGLEYRNERRDGPLSIHVVKVALDHKELDVRVRLAKGTSLGRETVRRVAEDLPTTVGKPLVVINGDYFEMGATGDPRYSGALEGMHISAGELVHQPLGNVLWFDDKGRPHLNVGVQTRLVMTWPDGTQNTFGINASTTAHKSEVGATDVVLHSPTFGAATRTDGGLELELAAVGGGDWLPLRASCSYQAVIRAVSRKGDMAISKDAMVVSIAEKAIENRHSVLKAGDRVTFTTTTEPDFKTATEAIGGGPVLLINSKKEPVQNDPTNRHPRTAIGFNATHFFIVAVDGRQPNLSVGMSHGELADLMASLGCTDALNLDGGGSTTLWLDGRVVNSPSDAAGERAVGNVVMIVKKPAAAVAP